MQDNLTLQNNMTTTQTNSNVIKNKTQIFETYKAFLQRENLEVNGVSKEFCEDHPNWEKENETNKGCWNCSGCSDCYDCYRCYDCSRSSRSSCCSDCHDFYDCYDCYRSYDCSRSSFCYDCHDCSGCYGGENKATDIPIIPNIHQTVLKSVSCENALNMSNWHSCETTHCRAGWIVTLAGDEGTKLEQQTSTLFAAMQIYYKSSDIKVSPVRFFDSDEKAMEDMRRCAELESQSKL